MTAEQTILLPPLTETCARCKGDGVIYSAEWQKYWEQPAAKSANPDDWPKPMPTEPEEFRRFNCRGSGSGESRGFSFF